MLTIAIESTGHRYFKTPPIFFLLLKIAGAIKNFGRGFRLT